MYSLTKTECLYVATKFNDEARAKVILRWEELEQSKQLDFDKPRTRCCNWRKTGKQNGKDVKSPRSVSPSKKPS